MYVAYTAAHWPMQAPENEIDKYKGKYSEGWEVIRRRRFEKEKSLGVIDSNVTLSPMDTRSWETEKDKPAMERRMETYAAMISIMDNGIGKIVKELKDEGIYENTVIIFLQDNGGNAEGTGYGGPNGETKPVAKDTSKVRPLGRDEIEYRINPPITRDGRFVMAGKQLMAGPADTYLAYLKPWANVSNTPFRKYKNFTYEGGISTPLIIHWPGGIKREKGTLVTDPEHEIDIMPTLTEIAGITYPEKYRNNEIIPYEGVSLVPTFTGKDLESRAIFWEHQANKAIREGKWKMVAAGNLHGNYGSWKTFTPYPWQLYDMSRDRSEQIDLSSEFPDVVKEMSKLWEEWAQRAKVYPMPWKEAPPEERSFYMSTPWQYPNF